MNRYTTAEMEEVAAKATPWDEIEALVRGIDAAEQSEGERRRRMDDLAKRIMRERPYMGMHGTSEFICLALGQHPCDPSRSAPS